MALTSLFLMSSVYLISIYLANIVRESLIPNSDEFLSIYAGVLDDP
jgi:hypothetical protein